MSKSKKDQKQVNTELLQQKVDPNFVKLLKTFKCFQPTPHDKDPVIKITGLRKTYTNLFRRTEVLKGIDLTIYHNDRIALLGANGAGKTTLLEIICGIEKLTEGKIEYLYPYTKTPQEKIGIQFQDASCPYGFSVYDLIKIQNSIIVNPLSDKDIAHLIEIFKLKPLLSKNAAKLSGGQKQRLNVALCFMANPSILFLDELSTALDIDMQFYLNQIIKEHIDEKQIALILSSHNVSEILYHCKRCVVIKQGKIVIDAPISAIIKHFKDFDYFLTNFLLL